MDIPSNIALIKYWGKIDNQIPINPSISFTLKESLTKQKLHLKNQRILNMNFFSMESKKMILGPN